METLEIRIAKCAYIFIRDLLRPCFRVVQHVAMLAF